MSVHFSVRYAVNRSFHRSLFFRLKEAEILELLDEIDEGNIESGDIVLHIPEEPAGALSDMDSDASDEETAGDINKVGPRLMRTRCDFIPHAPSDDPEDEPVSEPPPKNRGKRQARRKTTIQWCSSAPNFDINVQFNDSVRDEIEQSYDTEVDMFKKFIDNDFVEQLVAQTNLYSLQQGKALNVSADEIWVIFGGFLLSGYTKLPDKRLYWSRESDTPTILSEAIRCNRFEEIIHNVHFNDNTLHDGTDRLYKLRPLLDHMQKKFLEMNALDEHLSVDESMIPYYGRHFAKQYIKGKPIRFGFKNWALCSSSGYMYAFDVYVGKTGNEVHTELGAGGDVVVKLLQKSNVPSHEGYKVFFDNYFTSVKLLDHLHSKGICATGTVRENRLLNCPLPKKEAFNKKPKYSHQYSSSSSVMVMKYKDNNVVSIATNYDAPTIGSRKKYSTEKKGNVTVPQPQIVHHYNLYMGGVDMLDKMVALYRTRMRQRKWWWPIFVYFFDVAVTNSWIVWKKDQKQPKLPLLDYRRKLAIGILKHHGIPSSQGRRAPVPQDVVRYDKMNHWLRSCDYRRCKNCTGRAKFYCVKCNVGLHPKCHEEYHIPE